MKVVLAVVEQLLLLHTLQFYTVKTEMPHAHLVLLAEERVEYHPIYEILRLVHLLFAAVKLQADLRLAFLYLSTNPVH